MTSDREQDLRDRVAAFAQAPADPAYEPLDKAYAALRTRSYDDAIALFQHAIELVAGSPCAVAQGVVEVWPLQDSVS